MSACGDGSSIAGSADAALVVNDTTLSRADFNDQLAEWVKMFGPADTAGEGEGTYDQAFVANRLNLNVQFSALLDDLENQGIEITEEHRSAAVADIDAQMADLQAQSDSGGTPFTEPEEWFQLLLVDWTAANNALLDATTAAADIEVTEADVEAAYASYPESICSSHILVETIEEANEIVGLLAAGGDFAELAVERSTDPGSGAQGGDLGCVPFGSFVPEFEQAAQSATIGEVTDPVESQFGFHLILVSSVGVPPLEDVRADIEAQLNATVQQQAQLESQSAFEEAVTTAIDNAEISVDERYGTWDEATRAIISPEGSTPESVPVPDAGAVPGIPQLEE